MAVEKSAIVDIVQFHTVIVDLLYLSNFQCRTCHAQPNC